MHYLELTSNDWKKNPNNTSKTKNRVSRFEYNVSRKIKSEAIKNDLVIVLKNIDATDAIWRLLEDLKKSTLIAKYKKLAKQGG